jgi:uncharacterized ion transporter superfamily protein YfcC
MEQATKPKEKFKFPSTITLLALIILFVAILTYIIPAGEFDRTANEATGKTILFPEAIIESTSPLFPSRHY